MSYTHDDAMDELRAMWTELDTRKETILEKLDKTADKDEQLKLARDFVEIQQIIDHCDVDMNEANEVLWQYLNKE